MSFLIIRIEYRILSNSSFNVSFRSLHCFSCSKQRLCQTILELIRALSLNSRFNMGLTYAKSIVFGFLWVRQSSTLNNHINGNRKLLLLDVSIMMSVSIYHINITYHIVYIRRLLYYLHLKLYIFIFHKRVCLHYL